MPGIKPMNSTLFVRPLAAVVVMLLLAAGAVSAQNASPTSGPNPKWWTADRYIRELTLTQEQSQRLEQVFQSYLPTLRGQKKVLDIAEKEFNRLVETGADGEVMEQVGRLETARAELNKSRTLMLLAMRKVLTTDQWIKLGAMNQAAMKKKE